VLEKYLAEYNNRGDAELLLSEFKYGFRLQYTGPRIMSSFAIFADFPNSDIISMTLSNEVYLTAHQSLSIK
jgi:hypothetical protein